ARELARTTELGLRSELLENRLRFNATAFLLEVEDLQTPSAFVAPDGSISFLTQNFSDLENIGLELDLNWLVTDALTLDAAIGLQDAEYQNLGDPIVEQQAACEASPTNEGGDQGIIVADCSIAEPVRAPDVTLNVGGSYIMPIPGLGADLITSANARYVGETFTGTSNAAASFEDGYTLVNLGATLDFSELNWRMSVECKNCTDTAYITSNLPPTIYYNDPRRVSFRLRYDF
ncbi:MAG: TonB-dependent receptor, partial [Caulobacterales bacterium]|nr:TonB-dependent receptor [Caulobacterales bacterium]